MSRGDDDEPPSTSGRGEEATERQKRPAKRKRSKDAKEQEARIKRGPGLNVKDVSDKKLRGKLKHAETAFKESQSAAVEISNWLLPSDAGYLEAEGVERTWNFRQEAIVAAVEVGAARKAFDLSLPDLGPYAIDFTRSGRFMLMGGEMGHLALMDWSRSRLVAELQVRETVRDVCFLHNETFFAAAQKKYIYIYDKRGLEVHCLRDHGQANALDFLPHHFLLVAVGDTGVLRYQDTSTGHIIAQHKTQLGPCSVMRHNPYNAVMCLGHARGSVTLWSPNLTSPLAKLQCHRGPVTALSVDIGGHHLVTAGADNQLKVWDVRTYKPLHEYFTYNTITRMDISHRGMLAVGYGRKVQLWRDALRTKAQSPYMTHVLGAGAMHDLAFCPFEDVLGIGHAEGISTILVPGAGEPNFDSFVANPYASKRERQEGEVKGLLDKLQPDTIMLDPLDVARVRKAPAAVVKERREAEAAAHAARLAAQRIKSDAKTKMKGRNRPSRKHRKKQVNVIEEKLPLIQQRKKEEEERRAESAAKKAAAVPASAPRALHRFYKSAS